MASLPRIFLQRRLRRLATATLARYRPQIVGVTGSVGKTSTVRAIGVVLSSVSRVRTSGKSYNNEIGVPLSILGEETAGRSVIGWLGVAIRACARLLHRDGTYPEVLVLEMAADKPGDIEYLNSFLRPRIGVVTGVSATHVENFGSTEAVAKEKSNLVAALPERGIAILNADDPLVAAMRQHTAAHVITYGFGPKADVVGTRITYACHMGERKESLCLGMQCVVRYRGVEVDLELPQVLGEHMLYPALAAVAVGVARGMSLAAAVAPLRHYVPPPGRMRLLRGIKCTMIIDDSYNSSPLAAQAAVRVLSQVPSYEGRKYAVLGEMLELGKISGRAHRELGGQVARSKIDILVCVGELARDIARGAKTGGMSEDNVFTFPDARSAGQFLQERLRTGDVLLVKGSQAVRLERVVKELMADPLRAGELLVRQSSDWR